MIAVLFKTAYWSPDRTGRTGRTVRMSACPPDRTGRTGRLTHERPHTQPPIGLLKELDTTPCVYYPFYLLMDKLVYHYSVSGIPLQDHNTGILENQTGRLHNPGNSRIIYFVRIT